MEGLNKLEDAVLAKLLAGDEPLLLRCVHRLKEADWLRANTQG